MGLFDFLKKKEPAVTVPPVDNNWLVMQTLETKLRKKGHQLDWHAQYLALIVDGELELACLVIENRVVPM